MKVQFDSRSFLVGVFIFLTAASTVIFVVEARGYSLLYDSMSRVQFTLPRGYLQSPASNGASIIMEVKGDNPIDYGGLYVTEFVLLIYFTSSNSSLFRDNPLEKVSAINQAIAPHGLTLWNLTISLGLQDAMSITSFNNAYGGNVSANAFVQLVVTSNLLQAIGSFGKYPATGNLTLIRDPR